MDLGVEKREDRISGLRIGDRVGWQGGHHQEEKRDTAYGRRFGAERFPMPRDLGDGEWQRQNQEKQGGHHQEEKRDTAYGRRFGAERFPMPRDLGDGEWQRQNQEQQGGHHQEEKRDTAYG